jgi:hypothetical protein
MCVRAQLSTACLLGSIVSAVKSFNGAMVQWFNSFALPFSSGSIRCRGVVHWSNS